MLGHLATRTRHLVEKLASGQTAIIGGKSITALSESERKALSLIAIQLATAKERKGAELATLVEEQWSNVPQLPDAGADDDGTRSPVARKLGRIRATSFRGIAPAGACWEYDFESRSHLLHGPNGCGKSSLFGAICWCLTGRIFRDDCPPSEPEPVTYYSCGKKSKAEGSRPDALALLSADGSVSSAADGYCIEIELVSAAGTSDRVWLRRHSHEGLSSSSDGAEWSPIAELREIGISDLDVDLHVLMPAKLGHLRFGKDSEVLPLFSQIVGLDDLEVIADVAGRCHTTFTKEANGLEKNELKEVQETIRGLIEAVERTVPEHVKEMRGYETAIHSRCADSLGVLLQAIETRLCDLTTRLASDLGIVLPDSAASETAEVAKGLDLLPLLPGHIDMALSALAKPSSELLPLSVGLPVRPAEHIESEVAALESFVVSARAKIADRLDWAHRETLSNTAHLMLVAAGHFQPDLGTCPVCGQGLSPVPHVAETLEELHSFTGEPHLKQSVEDFARSLLSDLDEVIERHRRESARGSLGDRIRADWDSLKSSRFLGLIRAIADGRDDAIDALRKLPCSTPLAIPPVVPERHQLRFGPLFQSLEHAIIGAAAAIALDMDRALADEELTAGINEALKLGDGSLSHLLSRGQKTNQQIKELSAVRGQVNSLMQSQVKADALEVRIERLKELARATAAVKQLGAPVRQETINLVKEVEPVMKAYYERLYDAEHLELDMITPGHAANPNVKDEFNVYIRAGGIRLPAGPFANAGRLRALALCFVFSLHKCARGTLGFHLFDDPAISLDDEHKARFIDHLVGPCLSFQQVLLATHYEEFYKRAEPRFQDSERLVLVPRRSTEDAICFEPADLLQRVTTALESQTASWREAAINIRRWAERTLAAIHGYCPTPFVIFNNLSGSIDAYAAVQDIRVATGRRDKIVLALRSPQFSSIVHKLAHEEEVAKTEVRDALSILMECRKEVIAEIDRMRELHKHELLRRALRSRPPLKILQVGARSPRTDLLVTGHAAAASKGGGITWIHPEKLLLPECPTVLIRADVLAPIATIGQLALLDPEGKTPNDGDLTAVHAADHRHYLRRLWRYDGLLNLEATNPTCPFPPALLPADDCEVRRVIGTFSAGIRSKSGGPANEWATTGDMMPTLLDGVIGIRVDGTSLEPIARDGQIVLVQPLNGVTDLCSGELACIDADDVGAVLKRCYTFGDQLFMCPVNPVDVEEPIVVSIASVLHAHRIVGVLFERPAFGK